MDNLDNMDIPDMDEDSFASPFMLEHSTPTLQKVEEGQFQNKNDKKLASFFYTEILTLPEKTMGDSCTQHLDTFPLFSLPEIALDKVLSFLSYDQLSQMRVICKR